MIDKSLPYFLNEASKTYLESKENLQKQLSFLQSIDDLFIELIVDGGNITPPTAGVLIFNAHASLRASICLSLSGQLLLIYMALRGGIESALYANAMVVKPELERIWLNRERDEKHRSDCITAFSTRKIFKILEDSTEKDFSGFVKDVYEATIDFGAHPNSRSLIDSVRINQVPDGRKALHFTYLHGSESIQIRKALLACAEVSIAAFVVCLNSSPMHPRAKEMYQRAVDLKEYLTKYIDDLGIRQRYNKYS